MSVPMFVLHTVHETLDLNSIECKLLSQVLVYTCETFALLCMVSQL